MTQFDVAELVKVMQSAALTADGGLVHMCEIDAVCDIAAGQVAASEAKVPARSSRSPRHVSEDLVRSEGTVMKSLDS
jgi:hypothetical protein